VLLVEALLHGRQGALGSGQTFDRGHLAAVGLRGEQRAGLHRRAVEEHGAGAAVRGVATDVGAGEAQVLTEVVDEQRARLDLVLRGRTVDGHPYRERRTGFGKADRRALILPGRRVVRLLRARPDPSAGVRALRWYRAAHGPACGVLPVE
jgi:hypothetical protein